MIAFDTCVLVRLLVDDDPDQAAIAESLLQDNLVLLPFTVLLETEWVLRSRYRKSRQELLPFFRLLPELENVVIEDREKFMLALSWYESGADFADALHLSAAGPALMYTFDQRFCTSANRQDSDPQVVCLRPAH